MTSMILYTLFDSNVSNLMLCSSIVLGISTIIRTFHRWNHKPFSNLCLPFLLLSWCFHYMPTSNLIRPYKTIKILGYNGIYHDVHIYIHIMYNMYIYIICIYIYISPCSRVSPHQILVKSAWNPSTPWKSIWNHHFSDWCEEWESIHVHLLIHYHMKSLMKSPNLFCRGRWDSREAFRRDAEVSWGSTGFRECQHMKCHKSNGIYGNIWLMI